MKDFKKIESPFVRKVIDGYCIVTPEITPGYEWVFEDESVMAIEKLDGTNVSILIEDGELKGIANRKNPIHFFDKGASHIVMGILESNGRGYIEALGDGQHFGELIGKKVNGNLYKIRDHRWIPFSTYAQTSLKYKSWGKYPKDYETISGWFKELISLFSIKHGGEKVFIEGIIFTHPDGRMAKLRRDMFDWYEGRRHRH